MNKVVADALTLVYKFLMPLCSKFNPALIERGLLSIAGEDAFDFSSQLMPLGSYEKVQSTLARLNERESIRKNKGVYYTPTDVVDFIVANTIKASLGVLTPENIHSLDLASEFDEDFCLKKTVFEPTCGAGEFLLATLEQKLKLWRRNHFEATKEDIECIVGTFYFLRDRRRGYGDAIIEHFVFQVVPILREYVKDGILDVTENLIPLEHTAAEIHSAASGDEQIKMLSENIMMYVKEFGNLNKSNILIDNTYIGAFIDELKREFNF